MEKRIRVVWALSLILAALAIGVQAYWLYNQYIYVTDSYADEIAERILAACDSEHDKRRGESKTPMTLLMQRNSSTRLGEPADSADWNRKVAFSMSLNDSVHLNNISSKGAAAKVLQLQFSFDPKIPEADLQKSLTRTVTDMYSPFRRELLDSLLEATMTAPYRISDWDKAGEGDSVYYLASYRAKGGSVFKPSVKVLYAYNPFEKKGVYITADIPPQPVFGRMALQLLLSFGLIMLLVVCLVFQIKTILKQQKIGEMRENFVNTMIHELKRPVQTLKTFLAFLADRELRSDEEATRQVVQDSMFEIDNLSVYLNKLRDIIRTDSETTPLHIVSFDLRELVEKVIRLAPSTPDKSVNISARYYMESCTVEADPVHIANILGNLIENAVKYSSPSEVTIEIEAQSKGRELWLKVTDNGIGIPFAEQDRVFAKFYRASNLPDKNIPGLGLGLSYVKLVTEAHRGRVSLQSNAGGGTSILLYFPQ